MDQYWNLALIGRVFGTWTTAPGNDDDLECLAYTDRQAGVAYAHFNLRIHDLAWFPPRQSVRWTVTENRFGTRTCVASGTVNRPPVISVRPLLTLV